MGDVVEPSSVDWLEEASGFVRADRYTAEALKAERPIALVDSRDDTEDALARLR